MKINIIVSGHICLDLIPIIPEKFSSVGEIVIPGGLTNVGEIVISGGGPVFNVGKSLSRVLNKNKFELFLNAKTGDDIFADILERIAKEEKIKLNLKRDPKLNTSYTFAITTPTIDRAYLHNTGANDSFSSKDLIFPKGKPGLFHFGYPTLMKSIYSKEEELKNIFRMAKKRGYVTSMDMSLVSEHSEAAKRDWNKIISKASPYIDIFFLGVEEANFIINPKGYFKKKKDSMNNRKKICYSDKEISVFRDKLFSYGINLMVLKSGEGGVFLFSKSHFSKFSRTNWSNLSIKEEPKKIKNMKSTIGAGDNFAAGFINSYINGDAATIALKKAIGTASKSLFTYSG